MAFLTLLRKRLLGLLLVVFGVSLITFAISHLIPGDPARLIAGDRASDALVAGIRHQLGLDLPLYQQYGRYLMDLVQGDLGTSIRTSRPVLEDLQTFFPATLELALVALVLAILAGVPLGVLSAVYHNRAIDQIARTLAVTGISTPAFGSAWAQSFCSTVIWVGCREEGGCRRACSAADNQRFLSARLAARR